MSKFECEKIQVWSRLGTMMGLISKIEAEEMVNSGQYKIINGLAITPS